jgi:hypothetical protein
LAPSPEYAPGGQSATQPPGRPGAANGPVGTPRGAVDERTLAPVRAALVASLEVAEPMRQLAGLDLLRGVGIFGVVVLHAAFYHFAGLFDLDLESPPPVVTLIGFLLMFAGLFAIVSGFAHRLSRDAHLARRGATLRGELRRTAGAGFFVLLAGYGYFLLTGPALVDMDAATMDESTVVHLVRTGQWILPSVDRLLYVDALIMIGTNILLLGLFDHLVAPLEARLRPRARTAVPLVAALIVFAASIARIPLYDAYLGAVDRGDWPQILALNWLANKNNPILPYAAFGLFGRWAATVLLAGGFPALRRQVLPVAAAFLVGGVALYLNLPDTMLQRGIDLEWYAIMVMEVGLFLGLVVGALGLLDFRWDGTERSAVRRPAVRFVIRFGVAGLTVFCVESIVSETVFRLLGLAIPGLTLSLEGALAFGLCLALGWGIVLRAWEPSGYRFGLERGYAGLLKGLGGTTKSAKLGSPRAEPAA